MNISLAIFPSIPTFGFISLGLAFLFLLLRSFGFFRSKYTLVQCWFCSGSMYVAREYENSFVCRNCEQYNGFNRDGGYNRVIPEQYSMPAVQKRFCFSNRTIKKEKSLLCNSCTISQSQLIEKLADFNPERSICWTSDYNDYKLQLERQFPLCEQCRVCVKSTITNIDAKLIPSFIYWWKNVGCYRTKSSNLVESRVPYRNLTSAVPIIHGAVRFCALLIMMASITRNFVKSLDEQRCRVTTGRIQDSIVHHLHPFLPHFLVSCSSLRWIIHISSVPVVVKFISASLAFILQFIFVLFKYLRHFKSEPLFNPSNLSWFLLDVCLLVSTSYFSLSAISIFYFKNQVRETSPILYGVPILCFLFIPLLFTSYVCIVYWMKFFCTDWHEQKQTLKETWPNCKNHVECWSPYSSSDKSTGSFDEAPDDSIISNPIPEFSSNWGIGSHGPVLKSSLPSWLPTRSGTRSINTSGSTFTQCCDAFDDYQQSISPTSGMCSNRLDTSHKSNTYATPFSERSARSKQKVGKRRHHRRRRQGLLRFLLSLLFGRIDTLSDVVAEVLCLLNALLVGLVAFGLARLFLLFLQFF